MLITFTGNCAERHSFHIRFCTYLRQKKKETMENLTTKPTQHTITTETIAPKGLKTYVLNPISSAVAGFASFFILIFFTKLFSYIVGIDNSFTLGIEDVLYSSIGFILVLTYKVMELFKTE